MNTETTNDVTLDYELTSEERLDLEESSTIPQAPIRFKNQDFDVRGLVDRLNENHILIPRIGCNYDNLEMNPFQRGFVWTNKQMDSFIESLLLEYPVPGIFLVKQQADRNLVVLDGQQRLETLRKFYSGVRGNKVYKLNLDAGSKYNNMSYNELSDSDKRTLDDTYIESTIISASTDDSSKASEAIYDVFARLNSGGTHLSAHEIRMALYNGPLMELIDTENQRSNWRSLYSSNIPNKRFRDHELILRIIALYIDESEYRKPLAKFLNRFADKYRSGEESQITDAIQKFEQACSILYASKSSNVFSAAGNAQVNNAKADSIMVGLMKTLATNHNVSPAGAASAIETLSTDTRYRDAISQSTSDDLQVHLRIQLAQEAFSDAG